MTRLPLLLLLVLLPLAGCDKDKDSAGREVTHRPGQPDYVRSGNDAVMLRAYAKAKATHTDFIAALKNPKPSYTGFTVKKPFATPNGDQEHIWISKVIWTGTAFTGTIDNEPAETKLVKLGDKVTVTPTELSDWMYIDGKKVVGGYTLRALHYDSSPEEQKKFIKQTGLEVPAIDF